VATNALGHRLARSVGDEVTLGAYRRAHWMPWVPGATIDAWVPCARGEIATGVPQPHVYFVQTIGGGGAESLSIYCPDCRVDVASRRASGAAVALSSRHARPPVPRASTPSMPAQDVLPF